MLRRCFPMIVGLLFEPWEVVHGGIAMVGVAEAVGGKAVGEHYILAAEHRVIAHGLVEHAAVDLNARLLALDNNQGAAIAAHSHDVGTLGHAIDIDGVFLGDKLGCKATCSAQIVNNMAAHPLLGCEHEPAASHSIEDLGATLGIVACAKMDGGVVEFGVAHIVLFEKL